MSWAGKLSFLLICFAIFFTTIAYGGVHQPVLALFYLTTASLLLLWVIDSLNAGVIKLDPSPFQLLLACAAAYGFVQIIPFGQWTDATITGISGTISRDPFATMVNSIHTVALLVFFSVLLSLLDSVGRIRRFVNVLTIFGFVFAFYAILQSILSPSKIFGIYEVRYAAPFGSFVNRHDYAAFIEMIVALPLAFLLTGLIHRDRRLLYVTMTSLMGISLLLSGSRGGFVALIAEVFLMVLLTRRTHGHRSLLVRVSLAGALILIVIVGAIFVGGETSLSRFVETAQSKDITTSRGHIWGVTLKVIAANMPFGAGIGAFGVAYTPFDTLSGMERVEQAHNDYLQLAADMGVVGIILGIAFLYFFFKTGYRSLWIENRFRRSVAIGAFCGCFAVVVHSMFDFVLHITAVALVFISLISLLVAAQKAYPDETRRRSAESGQRGELTPLM